MTGGDRQISKYCERYSLLDDKLFPGRCYLAIACYFGKPIICEQKKPIICERSCKNPPYCAISGKNPIICEQGNPLFANDREKTY